MEMTLLGMVTEVREMQWENASPLIEVTLFGMVMDVREVQPANAACPMVVTLLGIVNAPALPLGYWINVVMVLS